MLGGEFHYSIDPKGRLNFPFKLREELGEKFVVAKSLVDKCLVVYSMEEWDKLVKKVSALPMAKGRNIRRRLFSSMSEQAPDKQGRILIPAELRKFAELKKDVTIIGVSDYCEIWDSETWEMLSDKIDNDDEIRETIVELEL